MSTPEPDDHTLPARVVTRPPVPLPRTLEDQLAFAAVAIKSGLALGHKNAESVVIALQMGAEWGFSPMQSLRMIDVIQGRPAPKADAFVARCLSSGLCEYFHEVETTMERSVWATKRRGAPAPKEFTFTLAEAKQAGLTGKDNWTKYPKRMLAARAKKFLAQDVYTDLVGGLLSAEELVDLGEEIERAEPIALPRRIGEAAPAREVAPVAPPDPPAPVLEEGDGRFDADGTLVPDAQPSLPGVATTLPPAEVTISEKERQELYRLCNAHSRSHADLKRWLATKNCPSAVAIPRALLEPAKAWVTGKDARAPGQEG